MYKFRISVQVKQVFFTGTIENKNKFFKKLKHLTSDLANINPLTVSTFLMRMQHLSQLTFHLYKRRQICFVIVSIRLSVRKTGLNLTVAIFLSRILGSFLHNKYLFTLLPPHIPKTEKKKKYIKIMKDLHHFFSTSFFKQ